jgi:hypothetical protein
MEGSHTKVSHHSKRLVDVTQQQLFSRSRPCRSRRGQEEKRAVEFRKMQQQEEDQEESKRERERERTRETVLELFFDLLRGQLSMLQQEINEPLLKNERNTHRTLSPTCKGKTKPKNKTTKTRPQQLCGERSHLQNQSKMRRQETGKGSQ